MKRTVSTLSPRHQSVRPLVCFSRQGKGVALLAGCSLLAVATLQANSEDDVASGLPANSILNNATSYSSTAPSTGGAPTTTSDVVFTAASDYSAATFYINPALSIGSLNDLSATAITLRNNNSSTAAPLTLNGGDSVSGNTLDLLYVATGSNLTILPNNTVSVVLGASGNFDVAGTATITAAITSAAAPTNTLTKTGAGQLNLSGQSTFAGNVTISNGTLNIGVAAANSGSTGPLGLSNTGKTVTVSAGATLSGTVTNWFGNQANTGTMPTITVNGGTLSSTRYVALGALNLNGATVTTTDTVDTGNYQTFALRGDVTVGGAAASTITTTTATATTGGVHLGANTTFTVADATGNANADLTVSAPLRDQSGDFANAAGGFTKAGAGTMLLTAASTYTGATAVNAGALFVGSTGSTAAGSAFTVSNAGTVLGGTGTIGGTVTVGNGATLMAGNAALATPATGVLTTGILTLQTGSTFNALLTNNSTFSTLAAAGTTALGGSAFSISLTPGATFTPGTLELITSAVSGTFTDASYTTGGYTFTANYTTNAGFFDVTIATAVPEPSTWAIGLVMAALAGVANRRKIGAWLRAARC